MYICGTGIPEGVAESKYIPELIGGCGPALQRLCQHRGGELDVLHRVLLLVLLDQEPQQGGDKVAQVRFWRQVDVRVGEQGGDQPDRQISR